MRVPGRHYRLVAIFVAAATWIVTVNPSVGRAKQVSAVQQAHGRYTAPKTPWGDPDLAGSYNNDAEARTPLERPAQFDSRRLEDITPDELLAFKKSLRDRDVKNSTPAADARGNVLPGGNTFLTELMATDRVLPGHQAWFIVDPPDGKIPAMTAEGRQR